MLEQRNARLRAALAVVVALTAALVAGGVLASKHPATPAATAPDSARSAATRPPLATATLPAPPMSAIGRATESADIPGTAVRALAPSLTPTAPVRIGWVEVARWEEDEIILTEPFTVHGPWRLCWTLPAGGEVFQAMIGDETQTSWDIETGPTGATAGSFDLGPGGTFSLMFHNDTPYTAIVIEPPPGVLPGAMAPPPCGP